MTLRWREGLAIGSLLLFTLCAAKDSRAQQPPGELAQIAALIKNGHLQDAEQRLERLTARHPDSVRAHRLLGDVRRAQGNSIEAAVNYENVVKLSPSDSGANHALAKLYLDTGEYEKSLAAAGRIPPERRTALLLPILAADYLAMKQPEKAALEIQAILNVARRNPDLVPELAEFFLKNGAIADAEQFLKVAETRGQPATDRIALASAKVRTAKGDAAAARVSLERFLDDSQKGIENIVEAGRIAGAGGDWNLAAQLLLRANRLSPRRVDVLQGLAAAQLYANHPAEALNTAKELNALRPDDLQSAYFLGLSFFGLHEWQKAQPYLETALRKDPASREMNLAMAGIQYNLHDLPDARKYVQFCLNQDGQDAGALYYLGLIQKSEGNLDLAVQSLRKSLATQPKNLDGQKELGALCLQSGDLPCARGALEAAAQLSPEDAQTHYQLSLAYSRSGSAANATEQLAIYNQLKKNQAVQSRPAAP